MIKLLIVFFIGWFAAQLIKLLLERKFSLKSFLFESGGMPSSHTTAIVSSTAYLFLIEGISTPVVILFIISSIVIRDSYGVRYATGENAKVLKKKFPKEKIVLSEGHNLREVVLGGMLGITIALLVYTLW